MKKILQAIGFLLVVISFFGTMGTIANTNKLQQNYKKLLISYTELTNKYVELEVKVNQLDGKVAISQNKIVTDRMREIEQYFHIYNDQNNYIYQNMRFFVEMYEYNKEREAYFKLKSKYEPIPVK